MLGFFLFLALILYIVAGYAIGIASGVIAIVVYIIMEVVKKIESSPKKRVEETDSKDIPKIIGIISITAIVLFSVVGVIVNNKDFSKKTIVNESSVVSEEDSAKGKALNEAYAYIKDKYENIEVSKITNSIKVRRDDFLDLQKVVEVNYNLRENGALDCGTIIDNLSTEEAIELEERALSFLTKKLGAASDSIEKENGDFTYMWKYDKGMVYNNYSDGTLMIIINADSIETVESIIE